MVARRFSSGIRRPATPHGCVITAPSVSAPGISARCLAWVAGAGLVLAASGCTTHRDNLSRGERLYQQENFEESLALCRLMERDVDALSRAEQARYAYLRGMVDYRLGFKPHARHWLAIAHAIHEHEVKALEPEALAATTATLDELNREVYGLPPRDTESRGTEHVGPPAASPPGVAAPPGTACTQDADCSSGQSCVDGRCQP